jgi:nucleoside-diphosphate-sugar epimerase
MQVLIIGAAGMVGRKLTTRLLEEGDLGGRQKTNLVLHDIVTPEAPQSAPFEVATLFSDFSMPDKAEKLIASRLDTIF